MLPVKGKKSIEFQASLYQFMDTIEEALFAFILALKAYMKNEKLEARDLAFKVHKAESEADSLRRLLIRMLFRGALHAGIRPGLVRLVGKLDRIADHAEECADFLITQRPLIPESLRGKILQLCIESVDTFRPTKKAVMAMFEETYVLKDQIDSVNTIEAEVDKSEFKLIRTVFSGELDPAGQQHLGRFIWNIDNISHTCQDVADTIEAISVWKK